MIPTAIARYQTVQINTGSPGETLIALFEGLFRFLHVARHNMKQGDRAKYGKAISRSHAIISELLVSLQPQHAPELCDNLSRVYDFCLARLLYANRHSDLDALEEVLRVLSPIRDAFTVAVRSLAAQPQRMAASGR